VDERDLVDVFKRVLQPALLHRHEVDGHADADAVGLDHRVRRGNSDDDADDEEEEKLVDAVRKEADNQAGDHLLTPRLVVQLSSEVPAERGNKRRHQETEQKPRNAAHLEVARYGYGNLPRHRPDNDAEIQPEPRKYRNDKRKDEKRISEDPAGKLREEVADGDAARHHEAEKRECDKNQRDDVLKNPLACTLGSVV